MKVSGPQELQQAAPARLVGQLRNALKAIGFGPDDSELILKKYGDIAFDGISYLDSDLGSLRLELKAPGSKSVVAILSSLRNQDIRNMERVRRELFEHLDPPVPSATNPALAQAITERASVPRLKTYGLKEADARVYPTKVQLELEAALEDCGFIEYCTLRFVRYQSGVADTVGVHLGSDTQRTLLLSLQATTQGRRAMCELVVKDHNGMEVKAKLEKALTRKRDAVETQEEVRTPPPQPPAATVVPEASEGPSSMPATPNRPPGTNGLARLQPKGFTHREDDIRKYIDVLREKYGNTVMVAQAKEELVELLGVTGGKQGVGIIIKTLLRMGWFIETDEGGVYSIIKTGAVPTPPASRSTHAKANGHAPALPEDHPVRQRIDRLSSVLVEDAKRRAVMDAKLQQAAQLKQQSIELAARAAELEREAAGLEHTILGENHLADIDDLLNRIGNIVPPPSRVAAD